MNELADISGKRVLVVDDDIAFGRAIAEGLRSAGAIALGPSLTAFQAQCLLGRRRVDLVVLDTSLYGQVPDEFALSLEERAIPVLLLADGKVANMPATLRHFPVEQKPASPADCVGLVRRYLSEERTSRLTAVTRPVAPSRPTESALHRLARCIAATLERPAAT